jgi:hypothetical protein
MQRTLESRGFISAILAMAIGTLLFYAHPFPDGHIFLRVIAMRAPHAFLSFKYLYYTITRSCSPPRSLSPQPCSRASTSLRLRPARTSRQATCLIFYLAAKAFPIVLKPALHGLQLR